MLEPKAWLDDAVETLSSGAGTVRQGKRSRGLSSINPRGGLFNYAVKGFKVEENMWHLLDCCRLQIQLVFSLPSFEKPRLGFVFFLSMQTVVVSPQIVHHN